MSKTDLISWPMVSKLAWRSLWRQRRRTLITVSSIGMGLAVAIFFVAVGEGVYKQVVNDGVRMQAGHITLENPEYQVAPSIDLWIETGGGLRQDIEKMPEVERTKAIIQGQGVAKSGSGAVGVGVMGVEPRVEREMSPLVKRLIAGSYLATNDGNKVVIGSKLAERLKLEVGKKLVISTNNANGDLVEELCRVKGIFRTGAVEIDGYLIQIPIGFARQLYGLPDNGMTQLGVILKRQEDQRRALERIRQLTTGRTIQAYPWQEILPEVAAYIRMDRTSNWVFQVLLIMVILFTIFNTLLMSAMEREHEFSVFLALGTPLRQLKGQLLVESIYLALMGSGIGILIGGSVAAAMQIWGLDLAFLLPEGVTVSGLAISTKVHAKLTLAILVWTSGLVTGATMLLSWAPMRRIGRIKIAEMLR